MSLRVRVAKDPSPVLPSPSLTRVFQSQSRLSFRPCRRSVSQQPLFGIIVSFAQDLFMVA